MVTRKDKNQQKWYQVRQLDILKQKLFNTQKKYLDLLQLKYSCTDLDLELELLWLTVSECG